MTEVVPSYYHKFKCIAEKCIHNCCIGWEIDIDEETMSLYDVLDGELAERIRQNIEGDTPHFILSEGDRCPFLNKSGLCDIICEFGDGAICDICYLHPRFKNFYSSFEETGLGLCCEEAVRIILSETEPFSIAQPEDVSREENEFFKMRNDIFRILQNRSKSVKERFEELSKEFGFEFVFSLDELCMLYLSLERLDEKWTAEIKDLEGFYFDGGIFEDDDFQIFFEQLSVYFIFRHLNNAMYDGEYSRVIKFVCMSCYFVGALCMHHKCKSDNVGFEKMFDLVRMYSSETEYSEENTHRLINYR